jgi:hypothetical protein
MRQTKCNQIRRVTALFTLLVVPALQAADSDWNNLNALRPGDRITVIQADQKRIEARFDSASASSLVVQQNGRVSLQRQDIVRISRHGMSRRRRMLIGGAAGLAAGAVIAATVGRRLNNEGAFSGPAGGVATAGSVAGGLGIGLAAGSFGGNGSEVIYRRAEVR